MKKTKNNKSLKSKEEKTDDINLFYFLYQDENEENKMKTQKEKKEEINPVKLLEQLKKEEEDTKILLNKLYCRKKTNKDFVKEAEKEKNIKQRYETKKNLMRKKTYDNRILTNKILKDPKNIKRINKLDNKINNQIFQYFNDKRNNLDFITKLNLQYDEYRDDINNVDTNIMKNRAELKYIKSQNENKIKIEERKKLEEERKNHLLKLEKDNLRYQNLVKNNFKIEKNIKNKKNNLIDFKEEQKYKGTNLSPNEINNEQKNGKLSNKYEKSTKEDIKLIIKSGICQLPRVNDNLNFKAHDELNIILQMDIDRMKKLEKILLFKKKYKYFDISSYIQTGKMSEIKNAKKVRVKHEDIALSNFSPGFHINFDIGQNKPEDIIVYRNYLQSCKYNNSEHIQAYLLIAKNDLEVWTMVNEIDEYGRNGLMYLLIHNNINMIKLTLLSGVTLDDRTDIFKRNLIHYCCTNNISPEMMDIICHCIDFKNFADLCKYVDKCIPIDNNKIDEADTYSSEYQLNCEEKIKKFDDNIKIKDRILKEKGIIKLEKDDDDTYDYNYNKKQEKNNFIEVKRDIRNPYEDIYKKYVHISNIINMPDIEGNFPIHYLVNDKNINNMKKLEILVYFHAKVNVLNTDNMRAIEITDDKNIQQFLLKQEENLNAKESKKAPNDKINNETLTNNDQTKSIHNNLNSSKISNLNISQTLIDIDNIKYYTPEKVNSFFVGVERNNYLILSVIQQNFELFKYLLLEKKAKANYINENGYSVLNFIIQKKLWNYFSFLFNLPGNDKIDSTNQIFLALEKMKKYDKALIKNHRNELTYTGAALSVIDNMTKMNNNLLSLCIDKLNDMDFLKSLLILYDNYIDFFVINQEKDLLNNEKAYKKEQDKIMFKFANEVFNREYSKNKESLLIKCIKQNNLEMLEFLLNKVFCNNRKIEIDIYKTDFNGQNVLHHAVKLRQKKTIFYLVKYDADFGLLLSKKDIKNNTPKDLDKTNSFENELYTIWDAAKDNNINKLNILLNELKYYKINDQTRIKENTPLHLAIQYKADKAILFLILNGADKNIKNKEGLTPLPLEDFKTEKSNAAKFWIKKVKKILDGKIVNYIELDSCNFEKIVKKEEDIKFSEKIDIINGNIEKVKTNKKKNKKKNSDKEIDIDMDKLSYGILTNFKLNEILANIIKTIKEKKINIDNLIFKYDQNKTGVIENKYFNEFIKSFDISELKDNDIKFLKSFLEKDEKNNIKYSEFVKLIKN